MKKIKSIIALTLVFSLVLATTVMAKPSPRSSVIWAMYLSNAMATLNNQSSSSSSSSAKQSSDSSQSSQASQAAPAPAVTAEDVKSNGVPVVTEPAGPLALAALANSTTADGKTLGMTPVVKAVKNVFAPAGYTPGTPVTLTWAVAGVKDGAELFAYYILPDGKVAIAPVTVKGGYATFTVTALRAVALVEYVKAPTPVVSGLH